LPTQTGGGHERGWRAGTENTPSIVGLAAALELAQAHREEENARVAALRDRLIHGVLEAIPKSQLTGHPTERLPNSASFVFQGVEAESILLRLDMLGVAGSSGSACSTGEAEPSHVLVSMGLAMELCHSSLRLTLGRENTSDDVDYVLSVLPEIVRDLRAMSPLYEEDA
jgi:cysteine desulfurase